MQKQKHVLRKKVKREPSQTIQNDKFLIFSDLHLHPHQQNWRRVDDGLNILDWIHKTCIEQDIKTVFFLGDFFHTRDKLYTMVMSKAIRKMDIFSKSNIEIIMLVGNHDLPLKNTTKHHNLSMFLNQFKIVDGPCVWEGNKANIYMLPYIESIDKTKWALQEIEKLREKNKVNMLFGHFDIFSAKMGNTVSLSPFGLKPDQLSKNWDYVISGHYHSYQKIRQNVWYVGSPLQQNFGEVGQTKGIIIYDNGNFSFYENTFSPKFVDVHENNFTEEEVRGNFVRLFISDLSKVDEIRNTLVYEMGALKVADVKPIVEGENAIFDKKWDNKKDIAMLADEWVDRSEVSLDKSKLKLLGKDIIKSVNEYEI